MVCFVLKTHEVLFPVVSEMRVKKKNRILHQLLQCETAWTTVAQIQIKNQDLLQKPQRTLRLRFSSKGEGHRVTALLHTRPNRKHRFILYNIGRQNTGQAPIRDMELLLRRHKNSDEVWFPYIIICTKVWELHWFIKWMYLLNEKSSKKNFQ